jgi:hypothetical protein
LGMLVVGCGEAVLLNLSSGPQTLHLGKL